MARRETASLGLLRSNGLAPSATGVMKIITRAAVLNLVTATIVLFNGRYLGRALGEMRARGLSVDPGLIPQVSLLGWDHINLTDDAVWSDELAVGSDGFMLLRRVAL
jgi:hypothetical protein